MSMGMDVSSMDIANIKVFANKIISLSDYRSQLMTYLQNKMSVVAPNLAALIGDVVAARLISHAGSLTNLAKYPASTVQILGAEKALFRALKKRGNTPKYGLIFHSTFIGRAAAKNKGRISRFLANKASIACRMDCFSEEPNPIIGAALKKQVEDRLSFFETGTVPQKNVEAMKDACEKMKENEGNDAMQDDDSDAEAEASAEQVAKEEAKKAAKKEKKKKRKAAKKEAAEAEEEESAEAESEEPPKKKKKKKAKKEEVSEEMEEVAEEAASEEPEKKKKKKKKKSKSEE